MRRVCPSRGRHGSGQDGWDGIVDKRIGDCAQLVRRTDAQEAHQEEIEHRRARQQHQHAPPVRRKQHMCRTHVQLGVDRDMR